MKLLTFKANDEESTIWDELEAEVNGDASKEAVDSFEKIDWQRRDNVETCAAMGWELIAVIMNQPTGTYYAGMMAFAVYKRDGKHYLYEYCNDGTLEEINLKWLEVIQKDCE